MVTNKHTIDIFKQPYLSNPNIPTPLQRNSKPNAPNNQHNYHKRVVDMESLKFTHFPIEDCNVVDDHYVLELAMQLVKDVAHGEVLYLHCWGGHGRTGTVVCLMLHLIYGFSARECMTRCQKTHDLRQYPVQVGSPQTKTQCDQVVCVYLFYLQIPYYSLHIICT